MSVIIKGMEMPVSGTRYRVVEDLEGNKYLTSDEFFSGWYYPISSLPEKHGRLVDLDIIIKILNEVEADFDKIEFYQGACWFHVIAEFVKKATTIIKAEGE